MKYLNLVDVRQVQDTVDATGKWFQWHGTNRSFTPDCPYVVKVMHNTAGMRELKVEGTSIRVELAWAEPRNVQLAALQQRCYQLSVGQA